MTSLGNYLISLNLLPDLSKRNDNNSLCDCVEPNEIKVELYVRGRASRTVKSAAFQRRSDKEKRREVLLIMAVVTEVTVAVTRADTHCVTVPGRGLSAFCILSYLIFTTVIAGEY